MAVCLLPGSAIVTRRLQTMASPAHTACTTMPACMHCALPLHRLHDFSMPTAAAAAQDNTATPPKCMQPLENLHTLRTRCHTARQQGAA
jgi:hypothetical protein